MEYIRKSSILGKLPETAKIKGVAVSFSQYKEEKANLRSLRWNL